MLDENGSWLMSVGVLMMVSTVVLFLEGKVMIGQ